MANKKVSVFITMPEENSDMEDGQTARESLGFKKLSTTRLSKTTLKTIILAEV